MVNGQITSSIPLTRAKGNRWRSHELTKRSSNPWNTCRQRVPGANFVGVKADNNICVATRAELLEKCLRT